LAVVEMAEEFVRAAAAAAPPADELVGVLANSPARGDSAITRRRRATKTWDRDWDGTGEEGQS
jgi:hypothetical protein